MEEEVSAPAEATPGITAMPAASEEHISALMAWLMPDISPLIDHFENWTCPILTPSHGEYPSVPALMDQKQQQAPPPLVQPSMIYLDPSDQYVDLSHLRQRDLLSAADTFRLDHLDDHHSDHFPVCPKIFKPDYRYVKSEIPDVLLFS
jgi:hypothetical protein